MTYTVATLEISAEAFDEVKAKLQAINDGHELTRRKLNWQNDRTNGAIDMNGLALVRAPEPRQFDPLNDYVEHGEEP